MSVNNELIEKTAEKTGSFRYLVTKFDKNSWANVENATPIPFDLVNLETKTGKVVAGWWNRTSWEGSRLKRSDEVVRWKRRKYEHIK